MGANMLLQVTGSLESLDAVSLLAAVGPFIVMRPSVGFKTKRCRKRFVTVLDGTLERAITSMRSSMNLKT